MKGCQKTIIWILLPVFFLLLSGCLGHSNLSNVNKAPKNQSIVFGKLTLIDDGEPLNWDSAYTDIFHYLMILPPDTTWPKGYRLKKKGYFYWVLDPGEYNIVSFVSHGAFWIPQRKSMTHVKFIVPENSPSVFIGELIYKPGKRQYTYEVQEKCPSAFDMFKKRFPGMKETPVNSPMEKFSLGNTVDIEPVCNEAWGLACSENETEFTSFGFSGITPISPHANTDIPAEINSVLPLFEWQPSQFKDIQYDLAVYEAGSWIPHPNDRVEVPGRMVLYKERLTLPRYKVEKELKPRTKYYWTVRLRKNDTVTTWSKFSFVGRRIPYLSGRNELFCFATPPHGAE